MSLKCRKLKKEKSKVKSKTLQEVPVHHSAKYTISLSPKIPTLWRFQHFAGSTCTPLRQIYDKLITKDSNIQPFVKLKWAMGKRRKLNLPATPTTAETFKSALKERAGTIAPYFREMSKVADEFFLLFFGDVTSEQMKTVI